MIELTQVLKDVGATTKLTEKQELIKGLSRSSQELLHYCCNPFKTFGVKEKSISYLAHKLWANEKKENLDEFWELCDRLSARKLTGNEAKEEIGRVLSSYTAETSQTLEKILLKDLRCNLGATLINKVYKNLIPKFKVMLADKMDDRFKWDEGPWQVDYKYDGMRIFAVVEFSGVTYLSRKGIEQEHLSGVFDKALQRMWRTLGQDFVADGEVTGKDFQSTMQAKKSGSDRSGLIYNVFDLVTKDEWDAQKCDRAQSERSQTLQEIYDSSEVMKSNVRLPMFKLCQRRDEVEEFYQGLIENGAEGVIIKDLAAPYYFKRNRAWTKYKPVWTADLEIVGYFNGKGKYKHVLGGFSLVGTLEDATEVVANCGSGFSDTQRNEYWDKRDELVGLTVEVEYQEVTQNRKGGPPSLRFPVFKHFREDK